MSENELQDVLARHAAFWDRAEVDRPLLWTTPYVPYSSTPSYLLRDGSRAGDGTKMAPGVMDLQAVLRDSGIYTQWPSTRIWSIMLDVEQAVREDRDLNVVDGDYVACWGPPLLPWVEAILGCPVFHSDGSCWTKPVERDWTRLKQTGDWRDGPWLEEVLAANRWLVKATDGRMGVSQPLFRGPFDMATAAIDATDFCVRAMDRSTQLDEFMDYCTELYIGVARRRLAETPTFHGGYFAFVSWGLWAPGPTVRFQADNSYMISPRMYREQFMRFDRRVAAAFEYAAMGTHTSQAQHLPAYAEIPELRMIEVALDPPPFGRPPLDLLPQFREIQAAGKSLLLVGVVTRAELQGLLDGLSPRGLALRVEIREDE